MNSDAAQENERNTKEIMTVHSKVKLKAVSEVAPGIHNRNSNGVCPHIQENKQRWKKEQCRKHYISFSFSHTFCHYD
jgi:hypothetical protein